LNNKSTYQPPPYFEDDEITLKEIILTVKDYVKEVRSNILVLVATIILAMAGFYFLKKGEAATFTSKISFILQEDKDEIPFTNQNQIVRRGKKRGPSQLQQMATSSIVINRVLLEKITIEEKKDFFANHLIDIYGFQNSWNKEELEEKYQGLELNNFYFTQDTIQKFSNREYRALQILRDFVKKMYQINTENFSNINEISVSSTNETVSVEIKNLLFHTLKDAYIENTIGRTLRNYESLTTKVDSLEKKFRIAQGKLAAATDQTYGLISKSDYLTQSQREEETRRLNKVYQTFLEQQQQVEFNLKNKTPDFSIIDQTFLPIKYSPSLLKPLLLGAFIGAVLGIGFIVFRKIFRDALAS